MKRIITIAIVFIITSISAIAQDVYYCTYTLTSNAATYRCYVNGKLETVISSEESYSNVRSQSHIEELSNRYIKTGWLTKSDNIYFYTDTIPDDIKSIIKSWIDNNDVTAVEGGYINRPNRHTNTTYETKTPDEVTASLRRFAKANYLTESEDGCFAVIKQTPSLHQFLSGYVKLGFLTESDGTYRVNNQSIN